MNANSHRRAVRRWLWLSVATGLALGVFHSAPAQAAPIGPTTVLAGLSSQGYPSFFEISGGGRMLKVGAIALYMTCASGDQLVFPDRDLRIPITAAGKLHADFAQAPTQVSGGGTVGGTDTLTASLNRAHTRLTGTWRLVQTYISPTGQTDQCDSGPVQFTDVG